MTAILVRPVLSSLKAALRGTPVVCLLGPRQSAGPSLGYV